MTEYREILCGLTYDQIIQVAMTTPNKRAAAKKLGVSDKYFLVVIKRLGMGHWFRTEKSSNGPPPLISKDDLLSVHGMILDDAAELLGVCRNTVKKAIKREGLRHLFPNLGAASWISRRGYVG